MSTKLSALRAKRGETIDAMNALTDADDFDQKSFDDKKAELAKIDGQIAAAEESQRLQSSLAKPAASSDQTKVPAQPRRARYAKLKAFKGPTAEEDAYRSGMWVRAVIFKDDNAREWCRENGIAITKAQSEGSNTAGGYLVFPEMSTAIIDLREDFGTFRQSVPVTPMGSDKLSIPRRDTGLTASFVAENAETTAGDKTWGQVTLTAQKMTALTRMSTELAEDAVISIADDLAREMAYAFAVKEDAVGWNGTGAASDGGIIGVRTRIIDGTHTASIVEGAATHDLFSEIDATDLSNMMATLPKYAQRNAKWYGSTVAWALVFQRLAQAAGGTTMSETVAGIRTPMYMGYPVMIDQTLPTVTTTLNDVVMLFFGDLSLAVTMGERRGITIKTTEERYFEFDQVGIMASERIDIVAHSLGSTTVAGPIIGLIGTT